MAPKCFIVHRKLVNLMDFRCVNNSFKMKDMFTPCVMLKGEKTITHSKLHFEGF